MEAKDSEEQLKQFFKQDPQYLKNYVREHPENQMAWYLLGREYETQGKQGKALYCYSQAGQIYEAYEDQKVNLPKLAIDLDRGIAGLNGKGRKKAKASFLKIWSLRALRTGTAMLFLGVALLSAPGLSGRTEVQPTPPAALPPPDVTPAQIQTAKVYYLTGRKTQEAIGKALQQMLLQERPLSFAILVRGFPLGDSTWIDWLKAPETLLSVEAKAEGSQQQINYHDAESCRCEPSDPQRANGVVGAWMGQQEQRAVLTSAIAAYLRRSGQAPAEPYGLVADYPNNVLPGLTPYMTELFQREKEQLVKEAAAGNERQAASAVPTMFPPVRQTSSSGELTHPLSEPLEIIVDKSAHRLALVSGATVLRSYPVGLGGERTPEGSFVISEKVREPNGRSDGDFGSRGMTLSDTLYAIHGTNKPNSIGKDQSLGCIRMRQQDVEELFDMAPLGTRVTIGKGVLPTATSVNGQPLQLPPQGKDTNPNKVYKWLE